MITIFQSGLKHVTTVTCKTSFEGIHRFAEAPEEVAYLRVPHRHIFNVEVEMDVFHDDREVEFIMLKHKVDAYIRAYLDVNGVWQMDTLSCEQVAQMLMNYLEQQFDQSAQRDIVISVLEDNENGATVYGFHCCEEEEK